MFRTVRENWDFPSCKAEWCFHRYFGKDLRIKVYSFSLSTYSWSVSKTSELISVFLPIVKGFFWFIKPWVCFFFFLIRNLATCIFPFSPVGNIQISLCTVFYRCLLSHKALLWTLLSFSRFLETWWRKSFYFWTSCHITSAKEAASSAGSCCFIPFLAGSFGGMWYWC